MKNIFLVFNFESARFFLLVSNNLKYFFKHPYYLLIFYIIQLNTSKNIEILNIFKLNYFN